MKVAQPRDRFRMAPLLAALRHLAPRISAAAFLAQQPGCVIQYYDDTPQKDPAKALSRRTFHPRIARYKQRQRCAVTFSLQAFRGARRKEKILWFRTLGIDVDLVSGAERERIAETEIERRKDDYLRSCLLAFPLKPHCIIETRHGFHVLYRVRPRRDLAGIRQGEALNRRLVHLLRGDEHALLLTQVLRVPGFRQFKNPARPFLCRLLLDRGAAITPYALETVQAVLDAWDVFHGAGAETAAAPPAQGDAIARPKQRAWEDGLAGVAEGNRNCTAASIIGAILCRLPETLWELAGWGGLREWNGRNATALPERELRAVFLSIARREHQKRSADTGRNALAVRDRAMDDAPHREHRSAVLPRPAHDRADRPGRGRVPRDCAPAHGQGALGR